MTAPRQRWYRFSLRTIFVVVTVAAIPLGWLVWQIQIVRERKAILAEIQLLSPDPSRQFTVQSLEPFESKHGPIPQLDHVRISQVRTWLGDQSVFGINLPPTTSPELVNRAEIAFPESVFTYTSERIEFRDSLYAPADKRKPNIGTIFKTGLIEK